MITIESLIVRTFAMLQPLEQTSYPLIPCGNTRAATRPSPYTPPRHVFLMALTQRYTPHAFDELSEITLFSDRKFLARLRGAASVDMKQHLLCYREAFTVTDAQHWCSMASVAKAFSFASLGCGACIGLMGVLRSKLWLPRWAAEASVVKNAMWTAVTHTPAFLNVLTIRATVALWCHMIEVTMPCIDYSCSGLHKGEAGDTGWLWPYAIRLAIALAPTVIFSEMADYAQRVDGGRTVKRILAALRVSYAVVARIVKVWDYGDGSRRRRLIIVAIRKSVNNADDYDMPEPVFTAANPHTARDTAVPDSEVPEDHWRKEQLEIFYPYAKPAPGEMLKIGRLRPGMGHSLHPHLCISMDGTNNGPTTHGGGGTKPSLDWLWGEEQMANAVFWRRLTTVVEFYGIASLSLTVQVFHTSFCPDGYDLTKFLKDCVNQGWPAGSAFHMARSIAEFLAQQANMPAMPVAALTSSQHISLTTAPTDAHPSHLLLTDAGEFHDCVLMKQPTPRTAKVVVCDAVEVVQARRLWPWVPEAQGAKVSSTIAAGEERLIHAAEVCFAELCKPRGSKHWDEHSGTNGGMTATGEPTHVYLGSTNQWCPCTLLKMVSFQWCAVDVGDGQVTPVATALMAEYDATLVGQHVAAPASRH